MTIADIGKFLGEGLKRVYRLWDGFRKSVVRCILRCFRRSRSYELQTQDEDAQNGNSPETKNGNTKESEAKEKSPEAEATSKDEKSKEKDAENENGDKTTTEAKAAEELAADVATSIPVEWIFVLIVAYTFVGAGLFKLTEPWSLLEAFYFCFITMTTIGYGDFVPLNVSIRLLLDMPGLTVLSVSAKILCPEPTLYRPGFGHYHHEYRSGRQRVHQEGPLFRSQDSKRQAGLEQRSKHDKLRQLGQKALRSHRPADKGYGSCTGLLRRRLVPEVWRFCPELLQTPVLH